MGVVTGQVFYQDDVQSGDFIGREVADPPAFYSGGVCSGGCRYTDAAFIDYEPGISVYNGVIARTSFYGAFGSGGSITITGGFLVTATAEVPALAGQELFKMGMVTGWTQGWVSETCVDERSGTILMLCQQEVSAADATFGDSGAPVFSWDGFSDEVTLHGLLWGPPEGDPQITGYVYSDWGYLELELGSYTSGLNPIY